MKKWFSIILVIFILMLSLAISACRGCLDNDGPSDVTTTAGEETPSTPAAVTTQEPSATTTTEASQTTTEEPVVTTEFWTNRY